MKFNSHIFTLILCAFLCLTIPLSADNTPSVSLSGNGQSISDIRIARGDTFKSIKIAWKADISNTNYRVYRAKLVRGPWAMIGETRANEYNDNTAEPGIKYWYRLQAVHGSNTSPMTKPDWGYCRMEPLKGKSFDRIQNQRSRNMPILADTRQKNAAIKEMAYLEKYYMNSFKLSVIMLIAGSYMKNSALTVLDDFDRHSIDYQNRQLYLVKNEQYIVKFYSNKLFRIYDGSIPLHNITASIVFSSKGNYSRYTITGLDNRENGQHWNSGSEASIDIPVQNTNSDIYLDMNLTTKDTRTPGTLIVSVNETPLQTIKVSRAGKYRLLIPQSMISENIVKLRLTFPDAQKNIQTYNKPHSIAFRSLTLTERVFSNDLFSRLVQNGIFYCIPRGDKAVTRKDGTVLFVPYYEAIGMSTEYYKYYKNWRSSTILLSTSDKKLQNEIEKAEKKG